MSVNKASDLIGRPPVWLKLMAVVYADMVGYSRLIGLDDEGTLERLRALRSTLIDPAIDQHGGRTVFRPEGDFLLIVFDSIDGAMRCAVKVQPMMVSALPIRSSAFASASISAMRFLMALICMARR